MLALPLGKPAVVVQAWDSVLEVELGGSGVQGQL